MHEPDKNPETLLSVPSDLEAAMIVSALAAHQVDATTSGEFTAGFRAEAPGEVKVLVRRGDLERARQVLSDITRSAPATSARQVATTSGVTATGDGGLRLKLGILLLVLVGIGILRLL